MTISISEFYSNRSVLITGGSGFIGKVLIEKLLRSCPNIGHIYLLIRTTNRNGKQLDSEQRLKQQILNSKLFNLPTSKNLDFSKLVAISGDMTMPNLGLTEQDRQKLIENVSIIFHLAATVSFKGPMKHFVQQNVFGTESILQLGRELKQLQVIVYVSTAYSNCDRSVIEEKVYSLKQDVNKIIDQIIEKDDDKNPIKGDPILYGRPNPYTVSKALTECLIEKKYSDLPVVICRPSIVSYAYNEPTRGWCDSLNGISGLILLGSLGIAQTASVDYDKLTDLIPVDFVANSLIVIGYHSRMPSTEKKNVINITSGAKNPVTWKKIVNSVSDKVSSTPSIRMVRPTNKLRINSTVIGRMHHYFRSFFFHFLFAYIFDFLLIVIGQKRYMVKTMKRIQKYCDVYHHFLNNEWLFKHNHYDQIYRTLSVDDQLRFPSDVSTIDWNEYSNTIWIGTRRYLLNEDDSTIKQAIYRQRKINIIFGLIHFFVYLFMMIIPCMFAIIFPIRMILANYF
ncbi:fatty acyl-CoA reductase 1-like [Dermatophagoides pteronyssinus]|uniref:fatty acyl-CoA reductase 1-like n=1 Tax=Dermatophagoides pteronyssinus TaxID=6956 RepID=UPI003F66F78D